MVLPSLLLSSLLELVGGQVRADTCDGLQGLVCGIIECEGEDCSKFQADRIRNATSCTAQGPQGLSHRRNREDLSSSTFLPSHLPEHLLEELPVLFHVLFDIRL